VGERSGDQVKLPLEVVDRRMASCLNDMGDVRVMVAPKRMEPTVDELRMLRRLAWDRALSYLAGRADLAVVRKRMIPNRAPKGFAGVHGVYWTFLASLSSPQGMPNSIGDIGRLDGVLFGFDHVRTFKAYPSWEPLFDAIRRSVSPESRMDKRNKHNYWTRFCKGAVSGAGYFSRFGSLAEFRSYVADFARNLSTRPALPLLMGEEIFGVKFALACDFLKEAGFADYCKPDVHLLDIFSGLGICERSPLDVFRQVTAMAEEVGETPFAVDKVFWLIGSGRLDPYDKRYDFGTDKHEFVAMVLREWRRV
jgi:hypothetical protein